MTSASEVAALTAAAIFTANGMANASDRPAPTVVELFTSQGCSSCPPANENLVEISKRPDVLALSFSVTYWDYLGWKDSFGKKEFTERQETYEPPLRQQGPFTPQMVVNGRTSLVGNRLDDVETAVKAADKLIGPSLLLSKDGVRVGAFASPTGEEADIWLVRYSPKILKVPVSRGENGGSTLVQSHVVRSIDRLGGWSGAERTLPIGSEPHGLKTAVLVQVAHGGPILAAATD